MKANKLWSAGRELIAVTRKSTTLCYVTPCRPVYVSLLPGCMFGFLFDPEDRGSTFLDKSVPEDDILQLTSGNTTLPVSEEYYWGHTIAQMVRTVTNGKVVGSIPDKVTEEWRLLGCYAVRLL
jgi:hypothetical protein